MKKILFLITILGLFFISCENNLESSKKSEVQQEQDLPKLADKYLADKKYDDVSKIAETLINDEGRQAQGYFILARMCIEQKCFDDAIKNIDKAIEIDNTQSHFFAVKGSILRNIGKKEEALKVLYKAVEINNGHHIGNVYCDIAITQRELGLLNDALSNIDEAIKKENTRPDFYIEKGNIYKEMKNTELAMDNYKKALSLNPNKSDLAKIQKEMEIIK